MRAFKRASTMLGLTGIASAAMLIPGLAPGSSSGEAVANGGLLSFVASYQADADFDATGAEIVAYANGRMFVVNGDRGVIEVVSLANPANPTWLFDIDVSPWGPDVTSVDVYKDGRIVAAIPAGEEETDARANNGKVVFFSSDGTPRAVVEVGALPDMVTYTPNGRYVLVANEGEPTQDYSHDPEGSVSIINVNDAISGKAGAVKTARFTDFNVGGSRHNELPASVRIFGPGATVAQDLEPEYITVDADGRKAYVTLQENNAVAVIDVQKAKVDSIFALGYKDYSLPGNAFDASDRDPQGNPTYNPQNWPVRGLYMPDGIANYTVKGRTYFVTANEGDAREYEAYAEVNRLRDATGNSGIPLCADIFPNASSLRDNANLGRLNITTASGVRTSGANSPCYESINAFGARSFSIWKSSGQQVYDSANEFEEVTHDVYGQMMNSNHVENTAQGRSDDKGPEPEGVAIGQVGAKFYAFVGLERMGGVMVYDVSNPEAPFFVQYINNRDITANPPGQDLGAEGVRFVPKLESPTGRPLVLVANEVSGTVSIFQVN